MKKQCLVLILLMALSVATFAGTTKANGYPITPSPPTSPAIIQWVQPNGPANYGTLMTDPEFLAVYAQTQVYTPTTIIIEGKDVFQKSIEASATIYPGAGSQTPFIFNDTHSTTPTPVAFAQITKILQQNGTDNEVFEIFTHPEATIGSTLNAQPMEEYMGMYESSGSRGGIYLPGVYGTSSTPPYQVTVAPNYHYGTSDHPFEPRNPDPIKVVVNWDDTKNLPVIPEDRYPQTNEIAGQSGTTTLTIQGLDQTGSPITQTITILPGNTTIMVPGIWSTVCKVSGGSGSYYIFTEPKPERPLFTYTLLIDHISINPQSYDILANPDPYGDPGPTQWYPGKTGVIVALRDIDDNPIYASDYGKIGSTQIPNQIVVNFFTSGGTIQPSTNVTIPQYSANTVTNLTADTNPRTINVTAVAYVPACTGGAHLGFTLFAWTEMTEDGVNSANDYVWGRDWPIHTMQWGYTDSVGVQHTLDVPPKPWLPSYLGGPSRDGIKLDGPIYEVTIPLYTGCNLVSSPVSPLLDGLYYTNYPTSVTGDPLTTYPTIDPKGIPMDLLFGKTAAVDTIEAVWWYDSGQWHVFIPGISTMATDPTAYFRDGVGYWIKADQPCVLEISGVYLENGPFTPPKYSLTGNSWSLVGVTSLTGILRTDYLESTMGSTGIEAAGPVWEYNNPLMTNQPAFLGGWQRNPLYVYPTQAFWVYNKVPSPINVAP